MSKDTTSAPDIAEGDSPLIAKLKAHKAAQTGTASFTLPETGIKATWPKFKPHWVWMKAQRVAKNPKAVMDTYLPLLCKFDGENMTVEEFKTFVPTGDILDLTNEVMGDDDPEDESGNALN